MYSKWIISCAFQKIYFNEVMIFIIPFLLLFPKIGLFDVGVLILFIFSLLKGDKKFRIDPFVVSILLILSISLLSDELFSKYA